MFRVLYFSGKLNVRDHFISQYAERTSTEPRSASARYKYLTLCRTDLYIVQIFDVQMLFFRLLCSSFSTIPFYEACLDLLGVHILSYWIQLNFDFVFSWLFIILLFLLSKSIVYSPIILNCSYQIIRLYNTNITFELISGNLFPPERNWNSRHTSYVQFPV